MKYLMLLLVVVGGIWWIRQQRRPHTQTHKSSGPQVMVPCAHCGTHVPENDAVQGAHGVFCSATHRDAHQG